MIYSNDISVRDAREIYFARSGFNASTYTDRWAQLPVLGFKVSLPNFAARRKAVPLHDIDHILTEYQTDWPGEWQISAYELGTGCGRYWAGWAINSQALLMGAMMMPQKSLRAFARGRRSRGVYHYSSHEPLLSQKVGDLRQSTTVEDNVRPAAKDVFSFSAVVFVSLAVNTAPLWLAYALYSL